MKEDFALNHNDRDINPAIGVEISAAPAEIASSAITEFSRRVNPKTASCLRKLNQEATIHSIRENYRLLLASQVIKNTCALASTASQLGVLEPGVAEVLKTIVDCFALTSTEHMMKW